MLYRHCIFIQVPLQSVYVIKLFILKLVEAKLILQKFQWYLQNDTIHNVKEIYGNDIIITLN